MCRFVFLIFAMAYLASMAAAGPATNRHVIVITIDGFPAYLLDDPKSPIPNLRKIASEGVVAEGMKVSNPSVTWPNHTTLVTGVAPARHSVLYNGIMVPDKRGELQRVPEADKAQLVAVPTVYDFLHGKGFKTAAVNWPCTRNSKTLDDNFPDVPNMIGYSTPKLIEELVAAKILDDSSNSTFLDKTPSQRDDIWTDAVCHILRTRKPNFLLFHLLIVDGTHHRFGPQSPEGYDAVRQADQHIGQIFETLDQTGLRETTSVFITADHGFELVTNQIVANVLLRGAGLLETDDQQSRVQAISEGGTLMVYLHSSKTKKADRNRVVELFKNHEGVEQIIQPKDFGKYGYPAPGKNPAMADLVVCAKPGYGFSGAMKGDQVIVPTRKDGTGSHGYLSTNPKMNALLIASGRGIQKGKRIGVVDNLDIAPTAAYLLGEKLPKADGKVLRQILAGK
ncbi:MAG: ectonucleotide pyrophosphatase/phosphodiesterase [Verrucomicrobiota bacterium]